jgi:hypothetical protein
VGKGEPGHPFAFEIEGAYVGPRVIARLLKDVEGVTDVRVRKVFSSSIDVHVRFRYLDTAYVVWEPHGDYSRYWIGPEDSQVGGGDISCPQAAFERYRPPVHRRVFGDLLTGRLFKRSS